jgi:quercetin dioxygenase-like cupin family protein
MKTMRKMLTSLLRALSTANVLAYNSADAEVAKQTPLMTKDLPDVPGKEGLIERVVLSPGEVVPPHRH